MARVEIYTNPLCPYCFRAKKLLEAKGQEFEEIDIWAKAGARDEMVQRSGGRTSVPQIFIDGAHVGGCDDALALDHQGKLDPLLGKTGA